MNLIQLVRATLFISIIFIIGCKKSFQPKSSENETENYCAHCVEKLTVDQSKIIGYRTILFNNREVTFAILNDSNYYAGGDYFLRKWQVDLLDQRNNNAQRTAASEIVRQWHRGRVPYVISSSFSQTVRDRINDAIAHWTNNSSLTFISRTSEANYIEFITGSGCGSEYVGKRSNPGVQYVIISDACPFGSVVHEIGHAIGFFHEQQRADRGDFIQVLYPNMIQDPNVFYQFDTYEMIGIPGFQLGTFDFNSVMLYGSFAFSNTGLPTITRLDGTTFLAQRAGLAAGDIETANFIYGPPFVKPRYVTTDYGNQDEVFIEADIYLDIVDQNGNPATFNEARIIQLKHTVENYYSSTWHSSTSESTVTIPANTSSLLWSQGVELDHRMYDYGNIFYGHREYFNFIGGRVRY